MSWRRKGKSSEDGVTGHRDNLLGKSLRQVREGKWKGWEKAKLRAGEHRDWGQWGRKLGSQVDVDRPGELWGAGGLHLLRDGEPLKDFSRGGSRIRCEDAKAFTWRLVPKWSLTSEKSPKTTPIWAGFLGVLMAGEGVGLRVKKLFLKARSCPGATLYLLSVSPT